jgi:predicted dehydrogenase
LNESNLNQAADLVKKSQGKEPAKYTKDPNGYDAMLARDDIDGVLVATPTRFHCPMAIAAMKAGKHVATEVPAGFELDELWQLVDTKESTGKRYMMLENYLYSQRHMMIYQMARANAFGEPYYAECSYIHDCRFMLFKEDGSLDWWGEWVTKHYGNDYPTHALGPVSKWFGINEGDRMTGCSSMMTSPRILQKYANERFGKDSWQARKKWVQGDFVATLIQTAQGKVIRTDYDCNSPRPADIYYLMQGTEGIYHSRSGIFFEDKPGLWEEPDSFLKEYGHAYWKEHGQQAKSSGHGGADYFVVRDFVNMVARDREPWVDVYDAATWSSIFACSQQSIDRNGSLVDMPDFTRGQWRDPHWRDDSDRPTKL